MTGVGVGAPEPFDAGGLGEDLCGRERPAAADGEQRRSEPLDEGGVVLVDAANRSGLTKGGYIALAVASVIAAWFAVHSIYMLRYAHRVDPVGGISFHADDQPDYRDFAYIALTISMTFHVSDTDLTAKPIRRTAIQHALLSYLFGVVIVAIMINIVGSLAST